MTVLLVSNECALGGAETFILTLHAGLQARGHHCELFFFRHGPLERHLPPHAIVHFGNLADCVALVMRRRFDVVHARSSDWLVGVSALHRTGTRLVVTSHGYVAPGWMHANCAAFVTCAAWLAAAHEPFTDISIRVVLNGIDVRKFSPEPACTPSKPPIVAWVGRGIEPRKRLDRFAAIASRLHAAGVRIRLAEPYGPEAVARVHPAAAETLRPLAEFWAAVSVDAMPQFYREVAASGGCLISTASWEGLPLTVLEAQACGCPVIASDVRGTDECVDPAHGGVLFPDTMDDEAVADLVLDTIRATTEMRSRQEACARHVRSRFSVERMIDEYLDVYTSTPSRAVPGLTARIRRRLNLSPFTNWANYVQVRWSVGALQHEASVELLRRHQFAPAYAAAREALSTAPTLYLRPGRFRHLVRAFLGARRRPRADEPSPGESRLPGPASTQR